MFGGTQAHTPRWNIEYGGTGARNATDARENLGLGKVENTYDRDKNVLSAIKLTEIDQRLIKPYETPRCAISSYFTSESGLNNSYANSAYGDLLVLNGYTDDSGGYVNGLFFHKNAAKRILHYQADIWGTSWGTPHEIAYTTDNVASATKLQIPRKIFGQNFDGSSDVDGTVTTSTGLLKSSEYHYIDIGRNGFDRMNFNVYSGVFNFINTFNGNIIARIDQYGIDCNAKSATKLQTARTISIGGAVHGSAVFDGASNISINTSSNHGVIRAYANFNGVSNYFRKNVGIASIENQGSGRYLVTLSNAAPDANYIVQATCSHARYDAGSVNLDPTFAQTVNQFRLRCNFGGDNTVGSFAPEFLNILITY